MQTLSLDAMLVEPRLGDGLVRSKVKVQKVAICVLQHKIAYPLKNRALDIRGLAISRGVQPPYERWEHPVVLKAKVVVYELEVLACYWTKGRHLRLIWTISLMVHVLDLINLSSTRIWYSGTNLPGSFCSYVSALFTYAMVLLSLYQSPSPFIMFRSSC